MFEVNNKTIERMYLFLGQISTESFCVSSRYECCPPRLDICQMRHIINTPSGEHMLTARISVITQTERHLHTHTFMRTHTYTLPLVGCVIFQSCLSAVFWSPQCSLMITLSLPLSSAFSQKMRTHTFVCSSTRPSLPSSPALLESTSCKCFPASRS